jgi:sugar phosphate isomerase/epimerase
MVCQTISRKDEFVNKPKLSLGSWAFSFGPFSSAPWSFSKVLQFIADAGYDGVEINGFRPHPHPDDYDTVSKCKELVKEIEGHGLGISGYAPYLGDFPPAEVNSEVYLGMFRKSLAFCINCGIGLLRVDTVSPPVLLSPVEYGTRFDRITKTWHLAAEEAFRSGVRMVWEFEPAFWLNKPSEVMHLVDAVNHENFMLLFDTSHAYMGSVVGARQTGSCELLRGGVVEYGQMLGARVGHLHLIDSDGTLHNDETSTHAAFGQGNVDFKDVLNVMTPVVSNLPWWCVDFCFNPMTPSSGKEAVPIVRRLMDEVLR